MINNYNEAYKEYYDKVRGRVKGKVSESNKVLMTKDDIYPSTANVGSYSYRRGSYQLKSSKKKFAFIDKFILKLILTFVLFLGVFTLKVLPNKEAKEYYKVFKTAISTDFDYKKVIPSIEGFGFNYSDVKNKFEEEYKNVINKISNINLDDISEVLKL
ncbi:peptidase M23 [Clostridium sp. AL.422]|uniref:peptidase M23 n=1 Tax=Clostridium TaxID=1485 RepID=UPI00293DD847|nr:MULTISPECIES: peptidase M23 [unclassified Clostridium]MDV4149975.1 peptidase M23 [Clostridium sp. AL.422]